MDWERFFLVLWLIWTIATVAAFIAVLFFVQISHFALVAINGRIDRQTLALDDIFFPTHQFGKRWRCGFCPRADSQRPAVPEIPHLPLFICLQFVPSPVCSPTILNPRVFHLAARFCLDRLPPRHPRFLPSFSGCCEPCPWVHPRTGFFVSGLFCCAWPNESAPARGRQQKARSRAVA
jgi:hypothetical protein